MSKISVPRNVEELLTLANAIYAKHLVDGDKSPLSQLEDFNFDEIGPNLQRALQKHNEGESKRREAEKAIEERDILMGDVAGVVRSSAGLLKAVFAKTPRRLGDWGFEVSESTTTKAKVSDKKAGE